MIVDSKLSHTPLFYYANKDTVAVSEKYNARLMYDYESEGVFTSKTSLTYQDYDWWALNGYLDDKQKYYVAFSRSITLEENFRYFFSDKHEVYTSLSYETFTRDVGPTPTSRVSNPDKPGFSDVNNLSPNYLNISVQNEYQISEPLKSVVGVMFEKSDAYDDVVVPRASLIWDTTEKLTMKFLYGAGYLTPDPSTRMLIVVPGGNTRPNADLQPEFLNSYDINAIYRPSKQTKINLSVYRNETTDTISIVKDPSLPAPFVQEYRNTGNKVFLGMDLTVDHEFTENIRAWMTYGYTEGEIDQFTDSGESFRTKDVPFLNKHLFKAGVNVLFWNRKLNLYVADYFQNEQTTFETVPFQGGDKPLEGKLDAYNLVDVNLSTSQHFSKEWTLSAGIKNLFDEKGKNGEILFGSWSYFPGIPRRSWNASVNRSF